MAFGLTDRERLFLDRFNWLAWQAIRWAWFAFVVSLMLSK
jgi:hypothetical protein